MSSEIRAGNERTYWIISNGNGYVDGVTDPDLVTTVGNGWHIYWIGSDHEEYKNICANLGIVPRNFTNNIPTVSDTEVTNDPYMIIENLKHKLQELENIKTKIDSIDSISETVNQVQQDTLIEQNIIGNIQKQISDQQQYVSSIDSSVNQLSSEISTISPVIPGQRVSATQIRLWLIQNNITLQNVYDAINTIPDPITRESVLAQWEYAPYIEKNHPMIEPLASALGLSSYDIERAFNEASLLGVN